MSSAESFGGERPGGSRGPAVAFLFDGDHLQALGQQRGDEAGEVGLDARASAGNQQQRGLAGPRVAMDLVVHAEVAVGRVTVGECHTACYRR